MNDISDAALERAQELSNQVAGSAREALIHYVQSTSDIGLVIVTRLAARGFPFDHELIRLARSLVLPGAMPSRSSLAPRCDDCPLCGAEFSQTHMRHGKLTWTHPAPDDINTPRCLLAGMHLTAEQLPQWNKRTKPAPAAPTNIRSGACPECHTLTPTSYSAICGVANCPFKGEQL